MTPTTLKKSIMLAAPRETVWKFLTQPDEIAKWFHAPKSPLKEGAAFEMLGADSGDKLVWGTVNVARAPEYLEYTFAIAPMGGAVSTVKWQLSAVEGGTRLSLDHEGLPETAAAFGLLMALDKGWDGHLGDLRNAVNGSDA
jgi:uncharacterized protein YndB with AHSA1/START domain